MRFTSFVHIFLILAICKQFQIDKKHGIVFDFKVNATRCGIRLPRCYQSPEAPVGTPVKHPYKTSTTSTPHVHHQCSLTLVIYDKNAENRVSENE